MEVACCDGQSCDFTSYGRAVYEDVIHDINDDIDPSDLDACRKVIENVELLFTMGGALRIYRDAPFDARWCGQLLFCFELMLGTSILWGSRLPHRIKPEEGDRLFLHDVANDHLLLPCWLRAVAHVVVAHSYQYVPQVLQERIREHLTFASRLLDKQAATHKTGIEDLVAYYAKYQDGDWPTTKYCTVNSDVFVRNVTDLITNMDEHWSNPTTYSATLGLPNNYAERQNLLQRLALGGRCCDCCGRDCDESSVLRRCSRCELVWYCSKSCQTKDWKQNGHSNVCREKGDMRHARSHAAHDRRVPQSIGGGSISEGARACSEGLYRE